MSKPPKRISPPKARAVLSVDDDEHNANWIRILDQRRQEQKSAQSEKPPRKPRADRKKPDKPRHRPLTDAERAAMLEKWQKAFGKIPAWPDWAGPKPHEDKKP
jgi:hypothetical protein